MNQALVVLLSLMLSSQAAESERTRLIDRALQNNPLIGAARASMQEFEALYTKAKLSWLPRTRVEALGSATPAITYEENTDMDLSKWGPLASFEATMAMPLYTFGKLRLLKEMAVSGIDIGKARIKMARDEIRFQVNTAYFSNLHSRRLLDIIEDGKDKLEKARSYLAEHEEDEDFDQVDLLRLKVYDAKTRIQEFEAGRLKLISHTALSMLTGLDSALSQESLSTRVPAIKETVTVAGLLEKAKQNRPEVQALELASRLAGIETSLENRKWFPDILAVASFNWRKAWAIDISQNSGYNPYDTIFGGGGVGLVWNLDFGERIGNIDKTRAKQRRLTFQTNALLLKIEIAIAQKLQLARDACEITKLNKKAKRAARSWASSKSALYEAGTGDLKETIEALTKYFGIAVDVENSVLKSNLAMSALARECGITIEDLIGLE